MGKVKSWVEEEKEAMMASDEKFKDFQKLRNPLIKLLERNKEPEPTVQGGGTDEEEEEEEMVIRRQRRGKMVVEEDEEDTTPGADEAAVYVEGMNTHVPVSLLPYIFDDKPRSQEELGDIRVVEEMEMAPETEESVPVETGHVSEGAAVEEEVREQQAPVEPGDEDDSDDDDENEAEAEPQSPESAA